MRHQTLIGLWLLTAALAPAPPVIAQGASAEDKAAELARQALSLFEQGRWAEAVLAFDKAGQSAKSPVFDLYAARALRNASKLVEAEARFKLAANAELDASAPEPFVKARADAQQELAQLAPRIPKLRFAPSRPLLDAEVTVDGKKVDPSGAVAVNPGRHKVIVREQGKQVLEREVETSDGGGAIEIAFDPGSASASVTKPSASLDSPRAGSEGSLLPGALVLGGGIASLVAGGVTGGLALSLKNDLEESCPGGNCPESSREDLDSANRLATASTATFIIGGILAAGGVTLLILRPGGDSGEPAPSVSLAPTLGWQTAGLVLGGRF